MEDIEQSGDSVEDTSTRKLEKLDPKQEEVLMTFIKDFPGIPPEVRLDLLAKSQHPSQRQQAIKQSQRWIESAVREEMEGSGTPRGWDYQIGYAPYDVYTGERYPMPMIWANSTSPKGRRILEETKSLTPEQSAQHYKGRFFFANPQARQQFHEGKYYLSPNQRPQQPPPK